MTKPRKSSCLRRRSHIALHRPRMGPCYQHTWLLQMGANCPRRPKRAIPPTKWFHSTLRHPEERKRQYQQRKERQRQHQHQRRRRRRRRRLPRRHHHRALPVGAMDRKVQRTNPHRCRRFGLRSSYQAQEDQGPFSIAFCRISVIEGFIAS